MRIRAASSLSGQVGSPLAAYDRERLSRATDEMLVSWRSRPDQWSAYYNLGNYYAKIGQPDNALTEYETALKLQPDSALVLVNLAMLYARQQQPNKAEAALRQALKAEPDNAEADFNLGLLLGEQGKTKEAAQALRLALKASPRLSPAAYNLGVLLAKEQPAEALGYCRQAYSLQPANAKYAYTYAFYLVQAGRAQAALPVLHGFVDENPGDPSGYELLGDACKRLKQPAEALKIYRRAASGPGLGHDDRRRFAMMAQTLAATGR